VRVFLTHNTEDLEAYFGRALPELDAIAEVVRNPHERDLTPDEVIAAAGACEVIVAHRSTPGGHSVFERLPHLLAFLRCAVDISTIDLEAANTAGVLVARADKSFVASTAELALGLALDAARHISASTVDYREGREPPQRGGRQLSGSVAGIVGYGAIGAHLADLLLAVGMRVLVHDPFVAPPRDSRIEPVCLDELLAGSDVVFPLVPGGPDTAGLIGDTQLAAMKPGAVLVNVARGEVLDELAVAAALDSGHLDALAIDVGQAPDQRPSPALAARPNVVATPHLGGLTPQNADAQAASAVEQVRAILDGAMPPRAVNPDRADRLRAHWRRSAPDIQERSQ
jgi:D-3-phosphoglycerate dehydrogenase